MGRKRNPVEPTLRGSSGEGKSNDEPTLSNFRPLLEEAGKMVEEMKERSPSNPPEPR